MIPKYSFNVGSPLGGINEYGRKSNLPFPQPSSPAMQVNKYLNHQPLQDYGFQQAYSNNSSPLKQKNFFDRPSSDIPFEIANYDKKIFVPDGLITSVKGQKHFILPHAPGYSKSGDILDNLGSYDGQSRSKRSKDDLNDSEEEKNKAKHKKSKKKERKKSPDERKRSPKEKEKKKRKSKRAATLDSEPAK